MVASGSAVSGSSEVAIALAANSPYPSTFAYGGPEVFADADERQLGITSPTSHVKSIHSTHDTPDTPSARPWHLKMYNRAEATKGQTVTGTRHTTITRLLAAAAILVAALTTATACTSDTNAPTTAAASSSNSSLLATAPGVAKDSIEDVNSTKDMTGVITTYSDADIPKNPYFDLIPYVCPFLPDSLTRDKLGMDRKDTGFRGQHSLLQVCNMGNTPAINAGRLGVLVKMQATSVADVSASPTHTDLARDVPIWRNVTGTLYRNAGDDIGDAQFCNLAWGTFYGSAVVTVRVSGGYPADPCQKAREFAPLIAPYLPSKPVQMRPTES